MKNYRVTFTATEDFWVEAENEEEAIEIVEFDCSLKEWDSVEVEED